MFRFIRRAYHASRVRRYLHDVALLEQERKTFERRLDAALRDLHKERLALFFVDVHRPPITHAPGRGRGMTTGKIRSLTPMSDLLAQREKVNGKIEGTPGLPVLTDRIDKARARDYARPKTKIVGEAS